MYAIGWRNEFCHASIVKGDECASDGGKLVHCVISLVASSTALKGEWHGREYDYEGIFLTRDSSNEGGGSRARPSA